MQGQAVVLGKEDDTSRSQGFVGEGADLDLVAIAQSGRHAGAGCAKGDGKPLIEKGFDNAPMLVGGNGFVDWAVDGHQIAR